MLSATLPRRRRVGLRELANGLSHGGAFITVLAALARQLPWLKPPVSEFAARMKHETDLENRLFDLRFGTDSFRRATLSELGTDQKTGYDFAGWGTCPVNESFFHEMMRAARDEHVDLSRFTFVDVGAGKGKALMLATEYPFRRIVGVEIDEHLVSIARRNLAHYQTKRRRRLAAELLCHDFLQWPVPTEPVLLFFNDPFPYHLADRALAHVEASVRAHPRPVLVLYRKAELDVIERLDASPVLVSKCRSPFWHLYASRG